MAPQSARGEKAKMLAGELYRSNDAELIAARRRAHALTARYNAIADDEDPARAALLRELLGAVGDGAMVLPRFACDYGFNIALGRNAFVNYDCVFLDCAPIALGDDTMLGPAVQLYTAGHPLDAPTRRAAIEWARPITIGRDVWIGGGAIVLPGVTIGDGAVVGAGSVVTRDVPPASVAVGNPARVVRQIDRA